MLHTFRYTVQCSTTAIHLTPSLSYMTCTQRMQKTKWEHEIRLASAVWPSSIKTHKQTTTTSVKHCTTLQYNRSAGLPSSWSIKVACRHLPTSCFSTVYYSQHYTKQAFIAELLMIMVNAFNIASQPSTSSLTVPGVTHIWTRGHDEIIPLHKFRTDCQEQQSTRVKSSRSTTGTNSKMT